MPSRINRDNFVVHPQDFTVYDMGMYARDILRHNGDVDTATGRVTATWNSEVFDHAHLMSRTLDEPLPQFKLTGIEQNGQERSYSFGPGAAKIAVYDASHIALDTISTEQAHSSALDAITSHPFPRPDMVRNTPETERRYREVLSNTAVHAAIEDGLIDIYSLAATHDLTKYEAAATVAGEYGFHIDGIDVYFSQSLSDTRHAILAFAARAFYEQSSRRALTYKRDNPPTI